MSLKIITTGCSFTKDCYQKTWADYLKTTIKHSQVKNIAARGSGIDFLTARLMYECSKEKPDLVVILFPSVDRFDWYLDSSHPLVSDAVSIASWQNGENATLINIDGSLSNTRGYSLTGGENRGYKKFWYKYYHNNELSLLNYWSKIVLLQNYFDNNQIKYCFSLAYDRDDLIEQPYNKNGNCDLDLSWLYSQINWKNFALFNQTQGFLSFCRAKNFKIVRNHPITEAHDSWTSEILMPGISKILFF
jgi:hypothetical protein